MTIKRNDQAGQAADGSELNMNNRNRTGLVGSAVVGGLLLLAGYAASNATGDPVAPSAAKAHVSTPAPHRSMAPGMSMAPGETMAPGTSMNEAATAVPAPKTRTAPPSKSAAMICEAETAGNVATLTGLQSPPPKKATWADHLYTCTYQLPAGSLVLSAKESANPVAARGYFTALRARLGGTHPVTGLAALGLPGYESSTGKVVFLKDNITLQVDATALPHQVGPQKTSRLDVAYTVATDVLACWTGK